ncbi:MAG: glycoside hydrolase family 127 protein [Chitinophagaceae bacterium]|nr:glycoside hydrolase family 127 protein [Chitinophagaceae bacterium]
MAFGGNSRREHFPSNASCSDFVDDVEGPETCNTYNMLKLTADLFRMQPSVNYIDYYERALYNHILASQHPVHGVICVFHSRQAQTLPGVFISQCSHVVLCGQWDGKSWKV